MRKCALFTLVLLCLVGSLSVSFAAPKKVTITILRPGDMDKVKRFLEPAITKFEAANPDIRIEPIYMGWEGWETKYKAMFKSATQPDVIYWLARNIGEEGVYDHLFPVDEFVDKDVVYALPQGLLDMGMFRGKLMGVPACADPFVLFYRKDVFKAAGLDPERPPRTLLEFREYAKTIKDKTDVIPIGTYAKAAPTLQEQVSFFCYLWTGRPWLDENFKPTFNNKEGIEAVEFWHSLKPYVQPGELQYNRGDVRPLFRDGKVAMLMAEGPWIVPMLQEKYGQDLDKSPIGIGVFPGKAGYTGVGAWVIASRGKENDLEKAKAAGRFISFLSTPEEHYKHALIYGATPFFDSVLQKEGFNYGFWKTIKDARDGHPQFDEMASGHPAPMAIIQPLYEVWQKVWLEAMSPAKALAEAEKLVNDVNRRYGIR